MLIKAIVTCICIALLLAHYLWPHLEVDNVTIALALAAVVPWLSSIIKSVEVPGFKIELQEVKTALQQVTASQTAARAAGVHRRYFTAMYAAGPARRSTTTSAPDLVMGSRDPRLIIISLRIEIERRLYQLTRSLDLEAEGKPAAAILRELVAGNYIDPQAAAGLSQLISLGNSAAHGADVTPEAAQWAGDAGPAILDMLDGLIAETAPKISVEDVTPGRKWHPE
jgi:hypothetical protein